MKITIESIQYRREAVTDNNDYDDVNNVLKSQRDKLVVHHSNPTLKTHYQRRFDNS